MNRICCGKTGLTIRSLGCYSYVRVTGSGWPSLQNNLTHPNRWKALSFDLCSLQYDNAFLCRLYTFLIMFVGRDELF